MVALANQPVANGWLIVVRVDPTGLVIPPGQPIAEEVFLRPFFSKILEQIMRAAMDRVRNDALEKLVNEIRRRFCGGFSSKSWTTIKGKLEASPEFQLAFREGLVSSVHTDVHEPFAEWWNQELQRYIVAQLSAVPPQSADFGHLFKLFHVDIEIALPQLDFAYGGSGKSKSLVIPAGTAISFSVQLSTKPLVVKVTLCESIDMQA